MKTRIIGVGVIKNEQGQYLLCKMADDHGVYPGQWGIVGGGMEPDETVEETVTREIKEEVGLDVQTIKKLSFADDKRTKIHRDGTSEEQYLIFLLFDIVAKGEVQLNDEWSDYAWVDQKDIVEYDLNAKTRENFELLGII